MAEQIVLFLAAYHIPPQLVVLLISVLPVIELRGSIPIGMGVFGMSPFEACAWSVLGNFIIAPVLLLVLDWFVRILTKHTEIFKKFFSWLFSHTRSKHGKRFEVYGGIALTVIAALPLPAFGTWGAVAAAYVFDVPARTSIPSIFLGVVISGIIVTLISIGSFAILTN